MSMDARRDRLEELLADRALAGTLEPQEEAELAALVSEGHGVDAASFDRAASAVAVAGVVSRYQAMPARLAARLETEALRAMPSRGESAARTVPMPDAPALPAAMHAQEAPAQGAPAHDAPPSNVVPLAPRPAGRLFATLGWVAAAACLALAVGVVWRSRGETTVVASAAEAREDLLARAGTTRIAWTATKDPAGASASGDVVWNAAEQRGFMRFRGLAKNDANVFQYQLWIFDATRDERYPVDGGVFDVTAEGDVIVPIRARLPVRQAALFAVTVEKPGGVVVSKRERIVVTAKPAG